VGGEAPLKVSGCSCKKVCTMLLNVWQYVFWMNFIMLFKWQILEIVIHLFNRPNRNEMTVDEITKQNIATVGRCKYC